MHRHRFFPRLPPEDGPITRGASTLPHAVALPGALGQPYSAPLAVELRHARPAVDSACDPYRRRLVFIGFTGVWPLAMQLEQYLG